MVINQITVFLENRAGKLLEITKILSENHIDLRAINIAETADYGLLRIIAADTEKAESVLKEAGLICLLANKKVASKIKRKILAKSDS